MRLFETESRFFQRAKQECASVSDGAWQTYMDLDECHDDAMQRSIASFFIDQVGDLASYWDEHDYVCGREEGRQFQMSDGEISMYCAYLRQLFTVGGIYK